MGLGSENQQRRKVVKSVVAKNDWKAKVRGSDQAQESIDSIKSTLAIDKHGEYLIDAYAGIKLSKLEQYKIYCTKKESEGVIPVTLKEFLNKN